MSSKSVFVTIVGRANAGKSSLLNKLVGEKIAAVSAKPQTTRTRITGVLTRGEIQYVFLDTPGVHKAHNKLSEHMLKAVSESVSEGELILMMADCTKKPNESERKLVEGFSKKTKVILAINKTDLIKDKEKLFEVITEYSSLYDFDEVVPISVVQEDGLDIIMELFEKNAVEGPHYFPDDKFTDQPEKVIMSEMIREKALQNLNEEVPHGIAVVIDTFKERSDDLTAIEASIITEKESHKGIIIGKGGSMLKKIGSDARRDIEEMTGTRVFLKLFVKVRKNWRDSESDLRDYGYDRKKL